MFLQILWKALLIVVLPDIGDNIAYRHGLHFCCQEVYPYRNQTPNNANYQLIGYPIAIGAGILSFLSPCILPLIPSFVAFVTGMSIEELTSKNSDKNRRREDKSRIKGGSVKDDQKPAVK